MTNNISGILVSALPVLSAALIWLPPVLFLTVCALVSGIWYWGTAGGTMSFSFSSKKKSGGDGYGVAVKQPLKVDIQSNYNSAPKPAVAQTKPQPKYSGNPFETPPPPQAFDPKGGARKALPDVPLPIDGAAWPSPDPVPGYYHETSPPNSYPGSYIPTSPTNGIRSFETNNGGLWGDGGFDDWEKPGRDGYYSPTPSKKFAKGGSEHMNGYVAANGNRYGMGNDRYISSTSVEDGDWDDLGDVCDNVEAVPALPSSFKSRMLAVVEPEPSHAPVALIVLALLSLVYYVIRRMRSRASRKALSDRVTVKRPCACPCR